MTQAEEAPEAAPEGQEEQAAEGQAKQEGDEVILHFSESSSSLSYHDI